MRISIAAAVVAGMALSFGVSASQGSGKVYFNGTVIDSPCSLTQTEYFIDFEQTSKTHLENGGTSLVKPLNITLEHCDLTTFSQAVVTFTGNTVAGVPDELSTAGTAAGMGVIINGYGQNVPFDGTPFDGIKLISGTNTLHFETWAKKAAGAQAAITEGDYSAISNFTIQYQ